MVDPLGESALVLGSGGQLGSRLAQHLSQIGYRVFGARRLGGFGDLAWDDLDSWMSVNSPGLIVNAASPSARFASEAPQEFLSWMTSHARNLLSWVESGTTHLISISTSQVYGNSPSGIQFEDSANPENPYATGHYQLEGTLSASEKTTVLRLTNSFGAAGAEGKLDLTLLTNQLIRDGLSAGMAEVTGNPAAQKNFVPVALLEAVTTHILQRQLSGVYNVASGKNRTVADWANQVVEQVSRYRNAPVELIFSGDELAVPDYAISSSKLKNSGFLESGQVDEELDGLIRQIEENLVANE